MNPQFALLTIDNFRGHRFSQDVTENKIGAKLLNKIKFTVVFYL